MHSKHDLIYLAATTASFSMHAFVVAKLIGNRTYRQVLPLVGVSAVSIVIQSAVVKELLVNRQHLYEQGSYLVKLIERHDADGTPIALDAFDVIALTNLFGAPKEVKEAEEE
jgi:hypothetical protein